MANSIDTPAADRDLPKANLVSVVIPCSNQAQFLDQAIVSVRAQSYANIEIIVVDDGPTYKTAEVVRCYASVQHVYQENAGLASAHNTGPRLSRSEFLAFLDSDDRLLPHSVEIGISCMQEHPECAFVSGHCRVIDSDAAILLHRYSFTSNASIIWNCFAATISRAQLPSSTSGTSLILCTVLTPRHLRSFR